MEGKPSAANGGRVTHIVKPGDTLFALALQYGVPVDQIMALNGLKPDSRIELGRELIIALPAPKPQADAPNSASGNPYVATGSAGSGRGTVCIQTFVDSDANGIRLAGESPLAASGLHLSVLNAQGEAVADKRLDGAASEACFTDLPATTYRVMADPPAGFMATQQQRWSISLPSDALVAVSFGVQPDPGAQTRFPGEWVLVLGGMFLLATLIGVALWLWKRRRPAW